MKKFFSKILIGCIALATLTTSLAALTIAWFTGPGGKTEDQAVDGVVGLRNYFYKGTGVFGDPYEIVTPEQFYNLSLLQSLGVFSSKKWFKVGHDFGSGTLMCMNGQTYESKLDMSKLPAGMTIRPIGTEGTPFYGNFDGSGIPICGLEVHGSPDDIGVFGYVAKGGNVENLVCQDLEIHSDGYSAVNTYPDYKLYHEDLVDVGTIFSNQASDFMNDTNLYFYVPSTGTDEVTWGSIKPGGFKGYNGSGTLISGLDVTTGTNATIKEVYEKDERGHDVLTGLLYKNGYFKFTHPNKTQTYPFTYSWESSSPLIKKVPLKTLIGGSSEEEVMAIDLQSISVIPANPEQATNDFNNGTANMQIDARISLSATYLDEVNNISYSRVIQTYKCEFNSHKTQYGSGGFTMRIYCDYMDQDIQQDHETNYVHGNNIGFLAGHVDGTIKDSYVYEGELHFNKTGNTSVYTESQIGLVGEIGTNVANGSINSVGKTENGDTGIINYSNIYNKIRDDMKVGMTVKAGHYGSQSYISYGRYLKDGYNSSRDILVDVVDPVTGDYVLDEYDEKVREAIEIVKDNQGNEIARINHGSTNSVSDFADFLRRYQNGPINEYITKTSSDMSAIQDDGWHDYQLNSIAQGSDFNSVDFLWNRIIEDEKDANGKITKNRGMGVFKILTVENTAVVDAIKADSSKYADYCLENLGATSILNGVPKTKVYFSTAEYDHTKSNLHNTFGSNGDGWNPFRATTIPSYPSDLAGEDIHSFDYPFSRDYNYCFEMDLEQMPLLRNGTSDEYNNYFWNTDSPFLTTYLNSVLVDADGTAVTKSGANNELYGFRFMSSEGEIVDSLSSYMPIGGLGSKVSFDDNNDGTADRAYPSNCIVFKIDNTDGANISVVANKGDITIHKINYEENSTTSYTTQKMYTMKSKNVSDYDSHRYFKYDATPNASPNTTTITEKYDDMGDNNALYGHIFHIRESGTYAISSENGTENSKARLYFLAVQGQDDASVGVKKNTALVGDANVNVDFIVNEPTLTLFSGDKANETNNLGKASFQFKAEFDNSSNKVFSVDVKKITNVGNYVRLNWDGTFVTALKLHSIKGNKYYICHDGTEKDYSLVEYPYPINQTNSGG